MTYAENLYCSTTFVVEISAIGTYATDSGSRTCDETHPNPCASLKLSQATMGEEEKPLFNVAYQIDFDPCAPQ